MLRVEVLSVIMLSVIMLSVIMLSVVMQSVVMLRVEVHTSLPDAASCKKLCQMDCSPFKGCSNNRFKLND